MNLILSGARCACAQTVHSSNRVVLTGGPGAGKTAVLELARRHFCEHIAMRHLHEERVIRSIRDMRDQKMSLRQICRVLLKLAYRRNAGARAGIRKW